MPIELADLLSSRAAAERDAAEPLAGELFLENSRLGPVSSRGYFARLHGLAADPEAARVYRQSGKTYPGAPRVPLPDAAPFAALPLNALPRDAAAGLGSGAVPAAGLSRLLSWAFGARGGPDGPARSVPTQLGMYPLELYVVCRDVEGVPPGVHHFNAYGHFLELLGPCAWAALDAVIPAEPAREHAAALVVATAVPLRATHLLGERGYRLVLTQAGRVAQNLYLGAAALGLAAVAADDFYDGPLNALLGVDGADELAVGAAFVGVPARG